MTVLEKGLGKKAVHRSHLSKLQKQNDELLNIILITNGASLREKIQQY